MEEVPGSLERVAVSLIKTRTNRNSVDFHTNACSRTRGRRDAPETAGGTMKALVVGADRRAASRSADRVRHLGDAARLGAGPFVAAGRSSRAFGRRPVDPVHRLPRPQRDAQLPRCRAPAGPARARLPAFDLQPSGRARDLRLVPAPAWVRSSVGRAPGQGGFGPVGRRDRRRDAPRPADAAPRRLEGGRSAVVRQRVPRGRRRRSRRFRRGDASRAVEAGHPVALSICSTRTCPPRDGACTKRLPDVDADVREGAPQRVEEHQVAGTQLVERHRLALAADSSDRSRQHQTQRTGRRVERDRCNRGRCRASSRRTGTARPAAPANG